MKDRDIFHKKYIKEKDSTRKNIIFRIYKTKRNAVVNKIRRNRGSYYSEFFENNKNKRAMLRSLGGGQIKKTHKNNSSQSQSFKNNNNNKNNNKTIITRTFLDTTLPFDDSKQLPQVSDQVLDKSDVRIRRKCPKTRFLSKNGQILDQKRVQKWPRFFCQNKNFH